jgi:uncharacterized protein (TIGR01244 family)
MVVPILSHLSTVEGRIMNKIKWITPHFAVSGALGPDDMRAAGAAGFKSIVSNLPDNEAGAPLTSAEEARLAAEAGLGFRHIPTTKHDVLSERVVGGMVEALSELESPVLGHCASGMRTILAWAAAAARHQPSDCVLGRLSKAGVDLSAMREELDAQHEQRLKRDRLPPALDCDCGARTPDAP